VQEEHHRAGDWEFGYYEGEGGELSPRGSTKELSGKGAPLILERCWAGGSVLTFATDMEGQILEGNLYQLGWIFVQGEENGTPIIMAGGLDGGYFTWVLADREPIIGGAILSICPSNDAKSSKCRTFSSKGMREAAAFLCRNDRKRQ
jgi:CubicO group peptidase (beta-lactamase class C family)